MRRFSLLNYPATLFFLFLLGLPLFDTDSIAFENWSVSIYGGQICENRLTEVIFKPQFANNHVLALAVGKQVLHHEDLLGLELEGQVVKHSETYESQNASTGAKDTETIDFEEFNLVMLLRWKKFPWQKTVNTSIAIGEGISYATSNPPIEINEYQDDDVSKFLNYLMIEVTASLNQLPNWHLFYRIHHRSGIYGLVEGKSGGSNIVGIGIRYYF